MATAQEKLRAVPQPIQDWFWSDAVDQAIVDIEQKFSLPETETALPRLLFALEVRDIKLSEFEGRLATELGITPALARSVYEEVKLKILLPIANDLVRFGIGEEELGAATKKTVPVPIGPQLDLRGSAISGAPASMPSSTPVAPQRVVPAPVAGTASVPAFVPTSAAPAPLPLHSDALANQQQVSAATASIGGPMGSGNIAPGVTPSAPPRRAARIDLGTAASLDSKFQSIFVEKKTPQLQEIDYSAQNVAPPAFSMTAPVPLATTPMPAMDLPVTPSPEVVSVPMQPEPDAAPSGFVDSIISKIAPWHSAKFGANRKHATDVLEAPIPADAKNVDYSETPTAPAPTHAGAPTPIDDLPAPPKA